MKGKSCIPENLLSPTAGYAETEEMMRTGMPAASIRARGPATPPQYDAGYMTATPPSVRQRFPLAPRGGPYMATSSSVPRTPCVRTRARLPRWEAGRDCSHKWLDGVSHALAYALRSLRDLRPLRHYGPTHAPTPAGDYPPRASHFPGGQRWLPTTSLATSSAVCRYPPVLTLSSRSPDSRVPAPRSRLAWRTVSATSSRLTP